MRFDIEKLRNKFYSKCCKVPILAQLETELYGCKDLVNLLTICPKCKTILKNEFYIIKKSKKNG